jgi:hypothetical protein
MYWLSPQLCRQVDSLLLDDPDAAYHYRFFEAPGVDHCGGGSGWFPGNGLRSLINWLEEAVASDALDAETQGDASERTAHLCLWSKSLPYVIGDPSKLMLSNVAEEDEATSREDL